MAKMNHGHFINPNGFRADIVDISYSWWTLKLHPTVIYRITLDKINPLIYQDKDHLYYQPDRVFDSDLGSVPWFLQWLVPKDLYRTAFVMHDSEHTHGGVWIASWKDGPYIFQRTTRQQADNRLRDMVAALGGGKIHQQGIWSGVRVGGWASWNKGDRRKSKLRELGKELLK